MIKGYVYHKQFVLLDQLNNLITQIAKSPKNYYFLRYSHGVSGICQKLPADRGEIEGQVFNSICEMRWKKYKSGYEVLILSKQEFSLQGFENLIGNWTIDNRNACFHGTEETRFPKGFIFKDENNQQMKPEEIPIKQRYFQDADTATIHFIALTVN